MPPSKMPRQPRTRFTAIAVLSLLLCLLLMGPSLCIRTATAASTDPIELLNLIYTPEATTETQVAAIWHGFNAAIYNAGAKTADGRDIIVYQKKTTDNASQVLQVLENALADHPNILALLGPYSDGRLLELITSPTVVSKNLVCIAPFTGSSAIRRFSRNVVFFRAEPNAELMVLLKAIINTQRALRIGFMYLSDVSFGEMELATVRAQLLAMGRDEPIIYVAGYHADVSQDAFDAFADQRPQAILVWGMPGAHVQAFMRTALADPRTANATFYTSVGVQDAAIAAYTSVVESGAAEAADDRFFFSTTNALPSVTDLNYVRVFQTEMYNYLANSPDSPSPSAPDFFVTNLGLGELSVGGWLAGRAMLMSLDNIRWTQSRSTYQAGLFEQNRYSIAGDFMVGNFGDTCVTQYAARDGAVCECNQGGRTTYLKRLTADGTLRMNLETRFTYPGTTCYSTNEVLPTPVNVLVLDYSDNDLLHDSFSHVSGYSARTASALNTDESTVSYNVFSAVTSTKTVAQGINTVKEDSHVDVILGPVPRNVDMEDNLVFDPIFLKPTTSFVDPRIVSLMPTVEQQIYVAYFFVKSAVSNNYILKDDIHLILKGFPADEVATLKDVAEKTSRTLSMPMPSIAEIDDATPITSKYTTTGGIFTLGITESDVQDIAVFLRDHPKTYALITYQDLARYYEAFVREFSAIPDPTLWFRCTFLTNLPAWNDASDTAHAASPTLKKFHAAFPDPADHNPRALQTFITTELLSYLVSITPTVNSSTLRTSLYQSSMFVLDDLQFGPFRDCSTSETNVCEDRNYGATAIGGVSMLRVLDPTQPYNLDPMVPSMVYADKVIDKSLSTGQIVGIAIGCAAFIGILVAVLLVIFCCCCNDSRDNKNAPRKVQDPVTLVFTDIESSTALWAAVPVDMPDAVATHHKLIRQLIAEYKCYEVKTIGDSFMIACKSPGAGVKLARDIQTRFLKHDWKAPAIDDAYHQFELNREAAEVEDMGKDGYRAHTAHLSPDVYTALWNGLRVRIGVHTGLSDIRQDETTHGFDYYGETSNMAARTEAIANGGQIVITDSTWWALSEEERVEIDGSSMGYQGLRGVPYAVEMYQLNAIVGRNYPPLRTEIEAYLPNDDYTEDGSAATDALLSSAGTLTGPSAAIAAVLTNCFSPYPPARRVKELQPLLEKWGIGVPPRSRNVSDTDYAQGLINRLAIKMSTVAQVRQRLGGGADSGLASAPLNSKRESTFSGHPGGNARPPTAKGRGSNSGGLSSAALASLDAKRGSVAYRSRPASTSQRLVMTSPVEESFDLVDEVAPVRRAMGRRAPPSRSPVNPLAVPMTANEAAAAGAGIQEDTIFVRMPSNLGA